MVTDASLCSDLCIISAGLKWEGLFRTLLALEVKIPLIFLITLHDSQLRQNGLETKTLTVELTIQKVNKCAGK